jgi:predicted dinucleotide-binding enzyme
MKIGIIGSGIVGQTLGTGLAGLGHEVKLGTREPSSEKVQEWLAKAGANASAGTFDEVATFGEVIILATHWDGTENALRLAGAENLAGKVLIDATNPLKFGPTGPDLAIGFTDSAGESVQRWAADSKVVKAFNIVPAALMVDAALLGETADMFIAGNDEEAKQTTTEILKAFGWSVVDMGSIEESRLIEPLGMLWIKHYFRTKNWQHAFKLIRK